MKAWVVSFLVALIILKLSKILFFLLLGTGVFLYLREKKRVFASQVESLDHSIFAPITGRVKWVEGTEIKINVRPFQNLSIYSPFTGSISKLEHSHGRFFFEVEGKTLEAVPFSGLLKIESILQVIDFIRQGASLGTFLLGGEVILNLPENTQILVGKGQTIYTGSSLIARIS